MSNERLTVGTRAAQSATGNAPGLDEELASHASRLAVDFGDLLDQHQLAELRWIVEELRSAPPSPDRLQEINRAIGRIAQTIEMRRKTGVDAVSREQRPTPDGSARPKLELSSPDPQAFVQQVLVRIVDGDQPLTPAFELGRVDAERKKHLLEAWDRLGSYEQREIIAGLSRAVKTLDWSNDVHPGLMVAELYRVFASWVPALFPKVLLDPLKATPLTWGTVFSVTVAGFAVALYDLYRAGEAILSGAPKDKILRKALRVGLDLAMFVTPFAIPASIGFAVYDAYQDVQKATNDESRAAHERALEKLKALSELLGPAPA